MKILVRNRTDIRKLGRNDHIFFFHNTNSFQKVNTLSKVAIISKTDKPITKFNIHLKQLTYF